MRYVLVLAVFFSACGPTGIVEEDPYCTKDDAGGACDKPITYCSAIIHDYDEDVNYSHTWMEVDGKVFDCGEMSTCSQEEVSKALKACGSEYY